jgi:hypothetical protein
LRFLSQPRCLVALEACGGAHYWGREIGKLGHTVRLIPPAYVKPFVKRQRNDAADAEAICEAAQRPSMRFVVVKDEAQQAGGVRLPKTSGNELVREFTAVYYRNFLLGDSRFCGNVWNLTDLGPTAGPHPRK